MKTILDCAQMSGPLYLLFSSQALQIHTSRNTPRFSICGSSLTPNQKSLSRWLTQDLFPSLLNIFSTAQVSLTQNAEYQKCHGFWILEYLFMHNELSWE
jgi:hypothetical protein